MPAPNPRFLGVEPFKDGIVVRFDFIYEIPKKYPSSFEIRQADLDHKDMTDKFAGELKRQALRENGKLDLQIPVPVKSFIWLRGILRYGGKEYDWRCKVEIKEGEWKNTHSLVGDITDETP
jgi:hypothetical protein